MVRKFPEISIIVPVYNVGEYLRECLDSIVSQTFEDWECILVDDGSPDDSGSICDEYASRDERFKVIHQKNGGLSAARNTGLKASKGKFIGFIDSDDMAHDKLFERLHELIIKYDADVSQVCYESLFTTFTRKKRLVDTVSILDRNMVAKELLSGRKIPNYMWIKLFKREVINCEFPSGMAFEDIYVMSEWVKNIKRMVLSPDVLYIYRRRAASIVNSGYAKSRIDYLQSEFKLIDSVRDIDRVGISEGMANKYKWKALIHSGKIISRLIDDAGIRENVLIRISEMGKYIPIPKFKEIGFKIWLRSHLLRDNPKVFIRLMRIVYTMDVHRHHSVNNQFG